MKDSKKNKSETSRSVLAVVSFEIEIEGRAPYTVNEEIDLAKLDRRELAEDFDEEEDIAEED